MVLHRAGRTIRMAATLLVIGWLVACQSAPVPSGANPKTPAYAADVSQETTNGIVRGFRNEKNGALSWLGVPYAQAPVGDLRWKAPAPATAWSGVKETKKYGNVSAQKSGAKVIGDEDCLYLNIWRPDSKTTKLPVLVFLHGGGNATGNGSSFPGDVLANRADAVIISINYRLSSLGWLNYSALKTGDPKADSGNFGLLDAIQALTWVKQNIESFGGDPANVTLSGQSAGGRDVIALLISPLAKGLFAKAIPLSGGMTLSDPALGESEARNMVTRLAVLDGKATDEAGATAWLAGQKPADIAAWLRAAPFDKIAAATNNPPIRMLPYPHLFKDGYVIPKEGYEVFKTGKYNQVPVLLGSCANEFALFALTDPYSGANIVNLGGLKDGAKIRLLRNANTWGSKLYSGFNSDSVADALVDVPGQPGVWAYRFDWGLREDVIGAPINWLVGASHGNDMDFVYGQFLSFIGQIYPKTYYTEANKPGRDALTLAMSGYIKNFLHTGNPNGSGLVTWKSWTKASNAERIMVLDAGPADADIHMSTEHLVKDEILKEMKSQLSPEDLSELMRLLDGRFFM